MPTLNGATVPYCGVLDYFAAKSTAAWGARLIVTQDGHVDLPYDRMGAAGEQTNEFLVRLAAQFTPSELCERIAKLLRSGEMDTRHAGDFLLYISDDVEVHANTNASGGYCYVIAFLRPAGETAAVREVATTVKVRIDRILLTALGNEDAYRQIVNAIDSALTTIAQGPTPWEGRVIRAGGIVSKVVPDGDG